MSYIEQMPLGAAPDWTPTAPPPKGHMWKWDEGRKKYIAVKKPAPTIYDQIRGQIITKKMTWRQAVGVFLGHAPEAILHYESLGDDNWTQVAKKLRSLNIGFPAPWPKRTQQPPPSEQAPPTMPTLPGTPTTPTPWQPEPAVPTAAWVGGGIAAAAVVLLLVLRKRKKK